MIHCTVISSSRNRNTFFCKATLSDNSFIPSPPQHSLSLLQGLKCNSALPHHPCRPPGFRFNFPDALLRKRLWGLAIHLQILSFGLQAHSLAAVIYSHFIPVHWGQPSQLFSLQHHVLTNEILYFPEKSKKTQRLALPVKNLSEGRPKHCFWKDKCSVLRKNVFPLLKMRVYLDKLRSTSNSRKSSILTFYNTHLSTQCTN